MKKVKMIMTLMMCLLMVVSFGQIHVDSFYSNQKELLIYSTIEKFDSLKQSELFDKVKNWSGKNFVDAREVLISETKEQLVFCYRDASSLYVKTDWVENYVFFKKKFTLEKNLDWYVRMVVNIKDGKIKVSMYDDGNCYLNWVFEGNVIFNTPSRTLYLYKYFTKEGGFTSKEFSMGIVDFKKSCINTSKSLIEYIKSNNSKTNDNW